MTRVLIIDDSAVNRATLSQLFHGCPDLEVVGCARDGIDAIAQIRRHRPHVLTLDLEMPGMDGLSLLRWVMAEHPLPVVVVTSRQSNYSLFEALDLGALDFVLKPGRESPSLPDIRHELIRKIRDVAGARLRLDRLTRTGKEAIPCAGPGALPVVTAGIRLVALAASTGGPQALQQVLSSLPESFPAGIAIVQHMPAAFTGDFARRLDGLCPLSVREANDGDRLNPGEVLVAPGGRQLKIEKAAGGGFLALIEDLSHGDQYAPSADVLLESVARSAGASAAGIVMTGMGHDGTRGLAALSAAGGLTVAESERTAVVFGMPRHAITAGVVHRVVPVDAIAQLMVSMAEPQIAALPAKMPRAERVSHD